MDIIGYSDRNVTFEDMCAEADGQILTDLFMIEITYSTDCYHHPQQHHSITTLEAEGTHYSYRT